MTDLLGFTKFYKVPNDFKSQNMVDFDVEIIKIKKQAKIDAEKLKHSSGSPVPKMDSTGPAEKTF